MTNEDLVRHARILRNDLAGELPNGVGNTIDALCDALDAASVDTLPKGQDAKQGVAGTEGSAVANGETPTPGRPTIDQDGGDA